MKQLYGTITHIRPAFFAAVAYLFGILTAEAAGTEALFGWLLAACAALVGVIFLNKKRVLLFAALFCVFFVGMGMYAGQTQTDVSKFIGKDAVVEGRIAAVRTGEYAYTYTLENAEMIDGDGNREKIPGKLFIKAYNKNQKYGQKAEEGKADFVRYDCVRITGRMEEPKGPGVPNGFDDRRYCYAKGVYLRMDSEEIEKTGRAISGFESMLERARSALSSTADRLFGDEAPVAKALFLGNQTEMDEETVAGYRATGVAHVLAVSGLHVGFIAGILFFILKRIQINRWIQLAILAAVLVFYAMLTGMRVSVFRAVFMFLVLFLGRTLRRPTDTLTFLSLAFLATLLGNPAQVFDLGFQLSYGAVFSILCLAKPIAALFHANRSETALSACASAAGTAGTAPILINSFGTFSSYSILFNVIIIPLAMAATICAAIGIPLGCATDWLGMPFAWIGKGAIALMNLITQAGSNLPGAIAELPAIPVFGMAAIYGGIFLFSDYVRVSIKKKLICFGAAGVVCAFLVLIGIWTKPPVSIVFLKAGNANAAVISTKEGGDYLVDAGYSPDALADYLVKNGIFAQATILTHADEDHIGGAKAAAEKGRTGELYISAPERERLAEKYPDLKAKPLEKGDRIALGEDAELIALAPKPGEASEESNDNSLILLLRYRGRDIAAFMGDAPVDAAMEAFPGEWEIPVFVVGHHGSDTSTSKELVQKLNPKYAVISGEKELGEETKEALSDIPQWKTGELGSIFVDIDEEVTIRSMYANH